MALEEFFARGLATADPAREALEREKGGEKHGQREEHALDEQGRRAAGGARAGHGGARIGFSHHTHQDAACRARVHR